MKTIVGFLADFFRREWNTRYFLFVAFLLIVSFVGNYGFDLERRFLSPHPGQQIVFYFFLYLIPFFLTIVAYVYTSGKSELLRNRGFVGLAIFWSVLLATYIAFHNVPMYLLRSSPDLFAGIPGEFRWYAVRYAANIVPGLVVIVPLALYWYKMDRTTSAFYGFSSSNINLKTYLGILLLVAPIVVVASFGPDFQTAYPRFKFGLPPEANPFTIPAFEFCYGVDFVVVELLFRGFMVMAFARYLGTASIVPMVVVYAFIHFQKPMGEAIGSIFGGLVLGVISYNTKSIYGGIILHLGVAYLMELAGAFQLLRPHIVP